LGPFNRLASVAREGDRIALTAIERCEIAVTELLVSDRGDRA